MFNKSTNQKENKAMTDEKTALVEIEMNVVMPVLDVNFEKVKAELTAELSKYENVLVTEETFKDDKKLAQKLSGKGRLYKTERVAKVREISVPIKGFESQMKELEALCLSTSKAISDQVTVFENQKLEDFGILIAKSIETLRDKMEIADEYRIIGAEKPFIKLGSITAKGAMAKAAKDGIQGICDKELSLQKQVAFRLLQLESESYKAELLSPLVRENVESFLFTDDADYAAGLQRIIKSELARQEQAEITRKAKQKKIDDKKIADQKILDDEKLKQQSAQEESVEVKLANRFAEPHQSQEDNNQSGFASTAHSHNGHLNVNTQQNEFSNNSPDQYEQYAQQGMDQRLGSVEQSMGVPSHLQGQQNNQPAQQQSNKIKFTATATFELLAPSHVPETAIADKIFGRMKQSGFDSITSVVVNKNV